MNDAKDVPALYDALAGGMRPSGDWILPPLQSRSARAARRKYLSLCATRIWPGARSGDECLTRTLFDLAKSIQWTSIASSPCRRPAAARLPPWHALVLRRIGRRIGGAVQGLGELLAREASSHLFRRPFCYLPRAAAILIILRPLALDLLLA